MAALAGLWSEAATAMALGTAVDLGELLAVMASLAPAACLAGLMAGCAVTLRLRELVDIEVLAGGACDDLLPLDGLDVTQVVVVHDADAAFKDVCNEKEMD